MRNQMMIAGYLLVAAALCFWLSWCLMPDPGTVETLHILKIVKESRQEVYSSVILQIGSTVLYMASLFMIAQEAMIRKIMLVGFTLFGTGLLGVCSDAFFHLLAWFMTDPSVTLQEDVVKVMDFMQKDGVMLLLPVLLPFFGGSVLLAVGLRRQQAITNKPQRIMILAIVAGILSELILGKIFRQRIPGIMIIILGLFAFGQVMIGIELIVNRKKMTGRASLPALSFRSIKN